MLKKQLLITAAAGCILLCSCAQTETAPPQIPDELTLSGKLENEGIDARVRLEKKDGVWSVTYTSPASVNGLTITDSGDERTQSFNGVTCSYDETDVPFVTAAQYITDSIDKAKSGTDITVTRQDDNIRISGTVHSSGYVLTFDSHGCIVGVSAGGYKLGCECEKDGENTSAPRAGADFAEHYLR